MMRSQRTIHARTRPCNYQVIDDVAAGRATAAVAKPLPGGGAENDARRVVYAAVGARVRRQVLAVELVVFVILKCQLTDRSRRRLYDAVQAVRQHVRILRLQPVHTSLVSATWFNWVTAQLVTVTRLNSTAT